MGKQRISAAIGFLVSTALVVFLLVGGEGSPRGEVTAPGETSARYGFRPADRERERPVWLEDYSSHLPLMGTLKAPVDSVERAESDALLDSFSPGVRASLEGSLLTQSEWEEAEYRAFIEERMLRLSEGRSLAD